MNCALSLLAQAAVQIPKDRIELPDWALIMLGSILLLYVLGLLGLSFYSSGQVQNEEDFLVAGRRLPLFLAWGSLIATWFGAASMSGAAQAARDDGLRGTVLDPWACSFTLILAGLVFAKPLWKMRLLTVADFFRRTYGSKAEIVQCCIQVPSYFGWIAGQYLALASVQEAYFGVQHDLAVFNAVAVTLIITLFGGMWSVTLTDTLQIVVAFIGLLVLGYASFSHLGEGSMFVGFSKFFSHFWGGAGQENFTLMPETKDLAGTALMASVLGWTGTWCTGLFGNIPGQDLQQRIFSAKSAKVAAQACIVSGITYLMFGLIPVSLGLMSNITDPEASQVRILMLMAGRYLSPALAVIFVVSFVSIVVSTATGAVLAPATILGHNVLGRMGWFKHSHLMMERLCVFLISMGGVVLAYSGESVLGLLDLSLSLALVGLFVPLALGLYAKPRGELSAVLAIIFGVSCFFLRYIPEKATWLDALCLISVLFLTLACCEGKVPRKLAFALYAILILPMVVPRVPGVGSAVLSSDARYALTWSVPKSCSGDDATFALVRKHVDQRTTEIMAAENLAKREAREKAKIEAYSETKLAEFRTLVERDAREHLSQFVPADQLDEQVKVATTDGLDQMGYLQLRFSEARVGGFVAKLIEWFFTCSADLYGMFASLMGYLLGQAILKKRGAQAPEFTLYQRLKKNIEPNCMPDPI